MDRIVGFSLITTIYAKDEIGQQIRTGETVRDLVGSVSSISRQEWTAAAQTGLNPECMIFMKDSADYQGEELAEIDGTRYGIYRTYLTDDGGIELYLRRNVGVNT